MDAHDSSKAIPLAAVAARLGSRGTFAALWGVIAFASKGQAFRAK
jgi:hypothetical protein